MNQQQYLAKLELLTEAFQPQISPSPACNQPTHTIVYCKWFIKYSKWFSYNAKIM